MSEARIPKGSWPAITPLEQIGGLRLRLYLLYGEDARSARRLEAFRSSWWPGLGPALRTLDECLPDLGDAASLLARRVGEIEAATYLQGLRAVADGIGLGRIPAVGEPNPLMLGYLPSGIAQAHRYLVRLDRAISGQVGRSSTLGRDFAGGRPTFAALARFGTPILVVDKTVGDHGAWDPRSETLADARRRLRRETTMSNREIGAGLARIVRDGGYLLPDTSARLERDATWVWWRIRHQWTYPRIAKEWLRLHPDEPHWELGSLDDALPGEAPNPVVLVRRAIRRYAVKAKVDVTTGPGRLPSQG